MDSLEREALEKKKKMIALGCLPLSVGFFVWRLQGSTSAAPPPPAPPPPVVAKAAPAVAAAAGPVLSLEQKKVVAVPVSGRDPFKPAFSLTPPVDYSATNKATDKPVITEPPVRLAGLPTLPMPDLKPFGPPPPLSVKLPQDVPVKPAAPVIPYVLTGIVKGSPDIAILRHADGSRRIARVGDMLDKKFRLAAIEETTVRIDGAGIQKTLELGQAGFSFQPADIAVIKKDAQTLPGTPDPKTETTLGEGNDTHNS